MPKEKEFSIEGYFKRVFYKMPKRKRKFKDFSKEYFLKCKRKKKIEDISPFYFVSNRVGGGELAVTI